MDTKKILITFLIILILGISGYLIRKNYFSPDIPSIPPENQISPEDARDNRRITDLDILREAVESYARIYDGQFPLANNWEKISDEESSIFKTLKADNLLNQPLKDPSPDRYYGYRSDGYKYELTAALENKAGGKCEMSGDLCLYKLTKTLEYLRNEYPEEYYQDYEEDYLYE